MPDIFQTMEEIMGIMEQMQTPPKSEEDYKQKLKECRRAIKRTKKLLNMSGSYPMVAYFAVPTKKILDEAEKKLKEMEWTPYKQQ